MTNTVELNQNVCKDEVCEVKIADDVVARIASFAATEIEGVDSMVNDIPNAVASKLGMNNTAHGAKVVILERDVKVDLAVVLNNNVQAVKVCEKVQERVKSAVESMTGLNVAEVNVKVEGIK